ncbi:MAG: hypothetical protein ABI459_07755, partial [Deltaproteobacteria bacterium]
MNTSNLRPIVKTIASDVRPRAFTFLVVLVLLLVPSLTHAQDQQRTPLAPPPAAAEAEAEPDDELDCGGDGTQMALNM